MKINNIKTKNRKLNKIVNKSKKLFILNAKKKRKNEKQKKKEMRSECFHRVAPLNSFSDPFTCFYRIELNRLFCLSVLQRVLPVTS